MNDGNTTQADHKHDVIFIFYYVSYNITVLYEPTELHKNYLRYMHNLLDQGSDSDKESHQQNNTETLNSDTSTQIFCHKIKTLKLLIFHNVE